MGYDSTPETNTFYTCARTGDTFANAAMARQLVKDCDAKPPVAVKCDPLAIRPGESSPGGMDYRARDANGNLITNQSGSQYWMDGAAVEFNQYSLDDPSMETKAQFSDANYAYADALSRVKALLIAGAVDRQIVPSTVGTAEYIKAAPVGGIGKSLKTDEIQPFAGDTSTPAGTTSDPNGGTMVALNQIMQTPAVKYAIMGVIALIVLITVIPAALGKRSPI
jgi:hypothetical protein